MSQSLNHEKVATIVEMLEAGAARHPDKTAIIHQDTCVSYQELDRQVRVIANFLLQHGIKKGHRVGVLTEKRPEAIVAFLAVSAAGGVFVPLDPHQRTTDVQFTLDLTNPAALVISARFLTLLSELRLPNPKVAIIAIGADGQCGHHPWHEILKTGLDAPPPVTCSPDEAVYLNFTSGTTGRPKGAITTHANIFWNTRASVEALNLTPDDVHLCMFPVYGHPHELFARPLHQGSTMVLVDSVSPREICEAIAAHRVTAMMATASIYLNIARFNAIHRVSLASLRIAESGGMHINPGMAKMLRDELNLPLFPVWGSTETCGIALACRPGRFWNPGSVGQACPGYQVSILDNQGRPAKPMEIGELVVSGPGVCRNYYRNDEETGLYFKDGAFHTGDIFRKDFDGQYYFLARQSRMIKSAGLKIYPTEIEDVLCSHPSVAEAAVVGMADSSRGEVPKACVVLKPGQDVHNQDLRAFCEKRLASCKVPRHIQVMEGLPKTQGGKIRYQDL